MLSYPSSLSDHSDFPTPVTCLLPVLSNLTHAYHPRSTDGGAGISGPNSDIFHRMPSALPRVHCKCLYPLLPCSFLPSPSDKRIGVYSDSLRFIPHPDSPSYTRPVKTPGAPPFSLCHGLRFWLAPLAGQDLPGFSGQAASVPCQGKFSPCVTTRTHPLPTHPKRATDVTTSSQVVRYRSHDLTLCNCLPICGKSLPTKWYIFTYFAITVILLNVNYMK